eukprot:2698486-Amphidinium_carterae.1
MCCRNSSAAWRRPADVRDNATQGIQRGGFRGHHGATAAEKINGHNNKIVVSTLPSYIGIPTCIMPLGVAD